ncbi:hypothetical protein RJ640_015858 [Escallonia rubra]|uniref:Uncharacterized protein n=1 Tax=Escallonia rubra TaxID=112253 RepID=A0AA88RA71_9ASTE|nr:hypothetical protein RJ640_015858 [Escallonia rubra]
MVSVPKAEGTDYRGSEQPKMLDRVLVGSRRVYTDGDPADFSFNAIVVAQGCAGDGLFLVLREITGDDIGGRGFGGWCDRFEWFRIGRKSADSTTPPELSYFSFESDIDFESKNIIPDRMSEHIM